MKKRFLSVFMIITMLSFSFTSNIASASTCPPHSNYVDRVIANSSPWITYHDYISGYKYNPDGILVPIYSTCSVTNYVLTHAIYCGICNLKMTTYSETRTSHGNCGK